jgi:glc operon protein GlcG
MESLGRAPEVQFLGDGYEVFDESQIQPFDRPSLLVGRATCIGLLWFLRPFCARRNRRLEVLLVPERSGAATTRPTLSGKASRLMVDAAVAEANAMSVPVTVAVVDESGVTKELLRMDGAPLVSVQTAINKAYAAAAIGMPPDDFYAAIESDSAAVAEFATRPGLALIAGGLPVIAEGRVAGAIGIAGAMTGAEDRRIGEAAIAAASG